MEDKVLQYVPYTHLAKNGELAVLSILTPIEEGFKIKFKLIDYKTYKYKVKIIGYVEQTSADEDSYGQESITLDIAKVEDRKIEVVIRKGGKTLSRGIDELNLAEKINISGYNAVDNYKREVKYNCPYVFLGKLKDNKLYAEAIVPFKGARADGISRSLENGIHQCEIKMLSDRSVDEYLYPIEILNGHAHLLTSKIDVLVTLKNKKNLKGVNNLINKNPGPGEKLRERKMRKSRKSVQ